MDAMSVHRLHVRGAWHQLDVDRATDETSLGPVLHLVRSGAWRPARPDVLLRARSGGLVVRVVLRVAVRAVTGADLIEALVNMLVAVPWRDIDGLAACDTSDPDHPATFLPSHGARPSERADAHAYAQSIMPAEQRDKDEAGGKV
jgi:hypothetical protein